MITLVSGMLGLSITAGVPSQAIAEYSRSVNQTTGVQLTIEISPADHYLQVGTIRVNINEVANSDPAIPLLMSLPIVNLGNHRIWEPFNPLFEPFDVYDVYYPFDRSQSRTAFGTIESYGHGPNFYADPGQAKILPPLLAPNEIKNPGTIVFIELPDKGIVTSTILPGNSVKKTGKDRYHVKFDTCELEIQGDECGVIEFTVKPNGLQTSTFNGTREDYFYPENLDKNTYKKLRFVGEFKDKSARVEGTVFGEKIFPGVNGIISEYNLKNITKVVSP